MLKYTTVPAKTGRLIIVKADDLMRYALHDSTDKPLYWQRVNNDCMALVSGEIKIYRKPSGTAYHKEYMRFTAHCNYIRADKKYMLTDIDIDRFTRNLYEFEAYV